MTKSFNTLRKKMSLSARKAAAAKTKEMPLQELRQAHQMSQERLAELLLTKQANVSLIYNIELLKLQNCSELDSNQHGVAPKGF